MAAHRIVFSLLIVLLLAAESKGAEGMNAEKEAVIRELIDVTGATNVGARISEAFIQQLSDILTRNNPQIPARALQIVREEVEATVQEQLDAETFQRQIYDIYARHFSLEELRALLAFNKTPVGRKASQIMPQLMQESVQIGQDWSQQLAPAIGQRILARFNEEGIQVNDQPPTPAKPD